MTIGLTRRYAEADRDRSTLDGQHGNDVEPGGRSAGKPPETSSLHGLHRLYRWIGCQSLYQADIKSLYFFSLSWTGDAPIGGLRRCSG
jgi:hypothetical protein